MALGCAVRIERGLSVARQIGRLPQFRHGVKSLSAGAATTVMMAQPNRHGRVKFSTSQSRRQVHYLQLRP
jgi:hypothetical protein